MRSDYERIFSHDAHLELSQWNNLDEKCKTWTTYNGQANQIRHRKKVVKKLIGSIQNDVLPHLTLRQRQSIVLYFHFQLTENQVARVLGISQPTVSQHIFGKLRNGKKVGGSIHKMRKIILKKASRYSRSSDNDSRGALRKILLERMSAWQDASYFE